LKKTAELFFFETKGMCQFKWRRCVILIEGGSMVETVVMQIESALAGQEQTIH